MLLYDGIGKGEEGRITLSDDTTMEELSILMDQMSSRQLTQLKRYLQWFLFKKKLRACWAFFLKY